MTKEDYKREIERLENIKRLIEIEVYKLEAMKNQAWNTFNHTGKTQEQLDLAFLTVCKINARIQKLKDGIDGNKIVYN